PFFTEPAEPALEVVGHANPCNLLQGEWQVLPSPAPSLVQNLSYLTITVIVEQLVDFGEDFWFEFANLSNWKRPLEDECPGSAASEPDVYRDLVRLEQSHIFDQQPKNALSLTYRECRIIPDPGKIGCQRQDSLPHFLIGPATLLLSVL